MKVLRSESKLFPMFTSTYKEMRTRGGDPSQSQLLSPHLRASAELLQTLVIRLPPLLTPYPTSDVHPEKSELTWSK